MSAVSGVCRCGAVRVEASAEPHFTGYCHCDDCRRATGAPVVAFAGFHDSELTWSGQPRSYVNGEVTRLFCGDCGSPLGYRDQRIGAVTYLHTAILDDPDRYAPTQHAFHGEKIAWFETTDDCPRHGRFSVERPS